MSVQKKPFSILSGSKRAHWCQGRKGRSTTSWKNKGSTARNLQNKKRENKAEAPRKRKNTHVPTQTPLKARVHTAKRPVQLLWEERELAMEWYREGTV